jgi:hypothetical protein
MEEKIQNSKVHSMRRDGSLVIESRDGTEYNVKLRDFLYIEYDILDDVVSVADLWLSDVYGYANRKGVKHPFEATIQTRGDKLVEITSKPRCSSPESSDRLKSEILSEFTDTKAVSDKRI